MYNPFIIQEACTIIYLLKILFWSVMMFVYMFFPPLYQDQNLIFEPDNDLILHKIFIKISSRLEKYDLRPKKDSFPLSTKKKWKRICRKR